MIRVRVPASIANLGPGFDVLAMAVGLHLEVEAEPSRSPEWRFEGLGAAFLAAHPNPISQLPMRGTVRNRIPVGVGLGSSAAARCAAAALRRPGAPAAELLAEVAEAEGHPDNAAAALFGGVVAVVSGTVHRLPAPELEVALLVSDQRVPTELARAVLPECVARADAVHNAAHLGLLVHALHTGQWGLLAEALEDRLHQPHRMPLYPHVNAALQAAGAAGALGAALAGAGPSVFAFCPAGEAAKVAEAMRVAAGRGQALTTQVVAGGIEVVGAAGC